MADELQIVLSAKDELSKELRKTLIGVEKLEAALKDATTSASPDAANKVELLDRALKDAQGEAKSLTRMIGTLDDKVDAFGNSAAAADRKTEGLNRSMDKGTRAGKGFAGGWAKMTGVVAGVTAAVGAAAGAFQFLASSVNEARTARKAVAQTAAVMRSMGRTEAPRAINKMIEELSSLSGIDDDALREMTNLMFTFGNVTGKTFEEANALALDVSVAFGKDLASSAVMVGKALNNPTKGLTALSRIGVQFTDEQTEQVKAMMETNDIAGAQAIVMKELRKQVGGSAAAQADGIDKTMVAWGNLKEAIGEALMTAGSGTGFNAVKILEDATRFIKRNKVEIVSVIQAIVSVIFKLISVWLKWESIVLKGIGYIIGGVASVLKVMAFLDPSLQGAADRASALADGFGEASEKADRASKYFDNLASKTGDAARESGKLKTKLQAVGVEVDNLNGKKVQNLLSGSDVAGVDRQGGQTIGDTRVGMGVGSLGAAGLQAAHAMYSGALGGHSITSGVRAFGLGSVHSDHRYGRAMDVQGPRLGAYAQVVRRNGGYAAMHGTGGNRHLHVVPQTRRPGPKPGNTFHADVTVNNPAQPMDIEAAVARGLRAAARQTAERGA